MWGHLLFNTKPQSEPDLITSILHTFVVKSFLGSSRGGHLGCRAGKQWSKCAMRSSRWRQNTSRLTRATHSALLWMCKAFCREVAMVTFQLSQTSSYCNYIWKPMSWESLIPGRKHGGGWLFGMFLNQPFSFWNKPHRFISLCLSQLPRGSRHPSCHPPKTSLNECLSQNTLKHVNITCILGDRQQLAHTNS